jgi:glycosyltransferase involved in cell wall biosynthesis
LTTKYDSRSAIIRQTPTGAEHLPQLKLLAISLAYPPLAYPRSIQVARLLKYLDASTALVCGDEADARKDQTIEPDAEEKLEACLRVPVESTGGQQLIDRLAYRFNRGLWNRRNMAPDNYGSWKKAVLAEISTFVKANDYRPDVVATFAQPFTDHLIGIELKQQYGLPWLAHFSDPWVDNPFNNYDEQTKTFNLSLERQVVESADILAFTSRETIDLVLAKYPSALREKARILPQSFDPSLFKFAGPDANSKITIRYIGNFYGQRTAAPLIDALRLMLATDADFLNDVRFELIGINDPAFIHDAGGSSLPPELLNVHPSVEYSESLRLMSEADGLLVIDAPAEISVFLPSKLIDYIGAGRPVLGITPPGTAASLIQNLGGQVVDPSDSHAIGDALTNFIDLLKKRRTVGFEIWGTPDVRSQFEVSRVAAAFKDMLADLT